MSLGGAFRVLLSELGAVGLDPVAVCAAAGIDVRIVHDVAVPFGIDAVAAVLQRAEVMADDTLVGLHMAERAQGRGVLSYLARAQATVGEGLEAFRSFASSTWGTAEAVRVERRGATTFVGFGLGAPVPRHAVEFLVTRTAMALRRSGAAAREAWFAHPPGGAAREYERVLRCPVRFRCPETGLALRARDLARPLRTANPDAAAALAGALASSPVQPASTAVRVAAVVEDALVRGDALDRETVARALGMSGKTLARRLVTEGRGFRDVVDAVRRAQAMRLVAEGRLDLAEVARCLGFADGGAFGKAFRRWFGEAPSACRARRAAG